MSALCQKRTRALQQKAVAGYVRWAFVRISRRRSKLSADQTALSHKIPELPWRLLAA